MLIYLQWFEILKDSHTKRLFIFIYQQTNKKGASKQASKQQQQQTDKL